jgi:hypothetical protein
MVNLIPFNPFNGSNFEEPSEEAVDNMVKIVSSYNVITIKRKHHGRDIAGACGQLAKMVKDIEDTETCRANHEFHATVVSMSRNLPIIPVLVTLAGFFVLASLLRYRR